MEHINNMTLENVQERKGDKNRNIIEGGQDISNLSSSKSNLINNFEVIEADILHSSLLENDSIQKLSNSKTKFLVQESPLFIESTKSYVHSPFILANTIDVPLQHLRSDCIIPVFSKDNEKTIAHQEFIEVVMDVIQKSFPNHTYSTPEIRVSHQIKGRTPDAIYKNAKDLLDHEKTIYYERMAFIIQIPSITSTIADNELALTVGGVRSYSQENLYNKKTFEKFKFFIGFQNKVCCNLCVSSDGLVEEMKVTNYSELSSKIERVIQNYKAEQHLEDMESLTNSFLTEHQFAQLIGRARLYQHLPKKEKLTLPDMNFNDGQLNTIAKDYYDDSSFSRSEDGRINLWKVYNLFTQANKSSYIDTFLDRNLNAFEFTQGIQKTLNGNESYHWFLS